MKDGRYFAPMLWESDDVTMMDNYTRALRRDESNIARFNRPENLEMKLSFIEGINKFVREGHAELMTAEMLAAPASSPIRYLSVQAVFKPGGKDCRPVFDASETTRDGKSLNNQLLPGPPIFNDLVEIMIRFRSRPIGIVGDIRGMFLAIGLADGQDSHRFLWRDLDPNKQVQIYRLRSVTFGVTDSPFKSCYIVRKHATDHQREYPLAYEAVKSDTYVDDTLTGAFTIQEGHNLVHEIIEVLKTGGFKFGKIQSSEPAILAALPDELKAPLSRVTINADGDQELMHSALGTSWDPATDQLFFRFANKFKLVKKETKRSLVSHASTAYDPLGMISPLTLEARKLIRACADRGMKWNDPLPKDLKIELAKWREEIEALAEIKIPRCVVPADSVDLQLHFFSDASSTAYGSCVYLRSVSRTGKITAHLIMSKNKLAPQNTLKRKIPRLELLGCLLSIRLFKYVKEALKMEFSRTLFWTDSMIAHAWILREPGSLKPFVGNRVREIQKFTSGSQWLHIAGENNGPADICSRGCSARELIDYDDWWTGPPTLYQQEDNWFRQGSPEMTQEEVELLKEEEKLPSPMVFITTRAQERLRVRNEKMANFKTNIVIKYRKWLKGIRVLATIQRAVRVFRGKKLTIDPLTGKPWPLTPKEIDEAVLGVLKEVQNASFSKEIQKVKNNEQMPKDSKLRELTPGFDKNKLLIVQGRLALSEWEERSKHPIILPAKNPITERIILFEHENCKHGGVAQTLYLVRQKYWPLGGHRAAKSVIASCQKCRIHKPIMLKQQMAPLPQVRSSCEPPFSHIGVDFAGPIMVHDKPDFTPSKAYICLFSCMTTRGIHLELVPNLDTQTFIDAFRRMVARRGWPNTIYSDNAKTFVRASKDLRLRCQDLDWMRAMEEVARDFSGIQWTFSCPKSPWWNGVFERMVGLVKERLYLSLKSNKLSFLGLTTVLCEVEAVVNSRPLACLRTDPMAPTPITPGHLMTGRLLTTIPDASVKTTENPTVLDRMRHQQALTRSFWSAFQRDYLTELQVRKTWKEQQDLSKLKDAVVLIKEVSMTTKAKWPMGVITQPIKGRDGLVRACEIRLANGKLIRRPVQSLALIDSYQYKEA